MGRILLFGWSDVGRNIHNVDRKTGGQQTQHHSQQRLTHAKARRIPSCTTEAG